nr:imidazolonepropionase [Pseudovibrio sp. M1P-2-3]
MALRLLTNAKLATLRENEVPYGLIEQGALVTHRDRIAFAGPEAELPEVFRSLPPEDQCSRLITPGLIDCHTHIIYGGNRSREFEMRLQGATYEEVALAGGGILSTVAATRRAEVDSLVAQALPRVDALIAEGVTTLEIKSGYGLDRETELNMLRAARQITAERQVRVKTSFLGAHAIPPEYKGNAEAYLSEVCLPTLEAAHQEDLVNAVDGFCEKIAFSRAQMRRVFEKAMQLGLPVKLHAEQLSNIGGAALAASYKALSVDHLEFLDKTGVRAMAEHGTVAVLLPGAYYTLCETQKPPMDLLRHFNVPIALATDCNPGSSPLTSLLLTMNMGCTLFRMTPEEALKGVTSHAGKALGLSETGTLEAGKRADLAIWNVDHPSELSYRIGFNSLHKRIFGGQ